MPICISELWAFDIHFWMLLNLLSHDFVNIAKEQFELLEGMAKRMTNLFQEIAKYFAFDPKKYPMEEFFRDIKTFCIQFSVSVKKRTINCGIFCFVLSFLCAKWGKGSEEIMTMTIDHRYIYTKRILTFTFDQLCTLL